MSDPFYDREAEQWRYDAPIRGASKTPAALTSAPAEPNDEAIEDFLAARMTAEGRVPMVKTIKEALKHFAAPPAAGAIDARWLEVASAEGSWIQQSQHLNCPVCGGSGHVDDIAPSGDATRRALLELLMLKEMKDQWEAEELNGFAYKSTDNHRIHNERRADYLRRQPAAWDAARKALASRQEAPAAAGAALAVVERFERAVSNCTKLHTEYMGKAMSDQAYDTFATLRDETIPALRKELLSALAATPAPETKGGV